DLRQHVGAMDEAPLAPPIDESERALAGKFCHTRLRQRRKVRVGEMRQHERRHCGAENYELPMRMPARNTRVPPTTTWNVAERNAWSMYGHGIWEGWVGWMAPTTAGSAGAPRKSQVRGGGLWPSPPIPVITPHTVPRISGAPRPVSEPSSESASANPIEMPA